MNRIEEIARQCLDLLLAEGATEGSCSVSVGTKTEFYYECGSLGLLRTVRNVSLSLKALVGTRKGVASLNSFEEEDLMRAVRQAVESAKISREDPAEGLPEVIAVKHFESGPREPDRDAMLFRLNEFFDALKKEYPSVSVDTASVDHTATESIYCTTNGICLSVTKGLYSFSPMFMAREGDKTSSFNYYGAVVDNLDRPLIDLADGRRALNDSVQQVSPVPMKGKFVGDVIFTPGCFGDLLSSVEGNFLSDGSLIDGTSIWKDKLNTPVAAPCLRWSSRPRSEEIVGGYFMAGGYEAENMELITDGVLKNFVLSRYGAKKTGRERSVSAGGCYFVDPGDKTLEEMIASVKHGLLVARFSGGSPSGDGTISGVAKNSFEIRDGKIVHAVSEAMISGNLAEMLRNITAISSETVNDGTSVLPWVSVRDIVISGQ